MIEFRILRRSAPNAGTAWQCFMYEPESPNETVATVLTNLNNRPECRENPIAWECSCLQKRCGACAMLINGSPRLACGTRLSTLKGTVTLEPLRKFPVVRDLIVDRRAARDSLKEMKLWLEDDAAPKEKDIARVYDAARCLQCGCCLEVCPNYGVGSFPGAAGALPSIRLLLLEDGPRKERLLTEYAKKFYEGCDKCLSCRDICPAGIPIDRLLVRVNGSVFVHELRRLFKKENKENK